MHLLGSSATNSVQFGQMTLSTLISLNKQLYSAAAEEGLRAQVTNRQTQHTETQIAVDRLSLQYDNWLLKRCLFFAATEEKSTVPDYAASQHLPVFFIAKLVRTVRNYWPFLLHMCCLNLIWSDSAR